ncbi:thiamine pyrophosphate-dependent enzyme [Thiovibrio sp. JS02]
MKQTSFQHLRDLPAGHLLGGGTPMCAGCGGLATLQQVYDHLGEKCVIVNAAGCLTLLSVYPCTPFRGSWLYTAMACAPAGAQGVRDGLDILKKKGLIREEEDMEVLVLTGDGSAYGMGLSATSATMDRNLDFLYLCYDNEGYGNTGQQFSAATPHAARTATSKGVRGCPGYKKDLFAIWMAQKPSYIATVVAAEPLDLARKIETARSLAGPRLILALAPCPPGWDHEPSATVEIGKLAVQTGIWPLKEYVAGKVRHTKIPYPRLPVREYLKTQGRFAHLFAPEENEGLLDEVQARVDRYWQGVEE